MKPQLRTNDDISRLELCLRILFYGRLVTVLMLGVCFCGIILWPGLPPVVSVMAVASLVVLIYLQAALVEWMRGDDERRSLGLRLCPHAVAGALVPVLWLIGMDTGLLVFLLGWAVVVDCELRTVTRDAARQMPPEERTSRVAGRGGVLFRGARVVIPALIPAYFVGYRATVQYLDRLGGCMAVSWLDFAIMNGLVAIVLLVLMKFVVSGLACTVCLHKLIDQTGRTTAEDLRDDY